MTDFTISINYLAKNLLERIELAAKVLFNGTISLELEMGKLQEDDLLGIMNQAIREVNKKKAPINKLVEGPKAPVIPMKPKKDK